MTKKELIKITRDEEGKSVVSGRELHEVLEIKTRYDKWMPRMIEYGFAEGVDYVVISEKVDGQKRPRTYEQVDHAMTIDMAKEIAMIQRSEIGKQVRNYFLECEKVALQVKPMTLTEMMELQFRIVKEQGERIGVVETDVNDIKNNMPLFPFECKDIQAEVKKKGIETLEGKEAPAYKNKSLRAKIYCDIYSQLKREFGVRRYEEIKRVKFNKAILNIKSYQAPEHLKDKIDLENNQISL